MPLLSCFNSNSRFYQDSLMPLVPDFNYIFSFYFLKILIWWLYYRYFQSLYYSPFKLNYKHDMVHCSPLLMSPFYVFLSVSFCSVHLFGWNSSSNIFFRLVCSSVYSELLHLCIYFSFTVIGK